MRYRAFKVPRVDLNKPTLTEEERKSFRNHWKFYCKDISPKRAEQFLVQSFPNMHLWDIKTMYKEWQPALFRGLECGKEQGHLWPS